VVGLDTVAVTMNAPTWIPAAARAVISPAPDTGERHTAAARSQPGQCRAGRVLSSKRCGASAADLILLMRARAIDKLAGKLIDEAKQPAQEVAIVTTDGCRSHPGDERAPAEGTAQGSKLVEPPGQESAAGGPR